eukprot:COSAG01_NODE_37103_length_508_cov_1.136919_2_plen_56_part_01
MVAGLPKFLAGLFCTGAAGNGRPAVPATVKLDAERRTAAEQAACDRDLCQAQEESL